MISTLFSALRHEEEAASFENTVAALDFGKEETCDEDIIWRQIYNIQSTPALGLKWKESRARGRLLPLLKVDPNNVVSDKKSCEIFP